MARKLFDTKTIQKEFQLAKQDINSKEQLFNGCYYMITSVAENISKRFRKKYPDDFEDILQNIRLNIWNVIEKLVTISQDEEQFTKLLVSSVIFSFRVNYRKYKKSNPVSVFPSISENSSWEPDEEVAIEIPIFSDNNHSDEHSHEKDIVARVPLLYVSKIDSELHNKKLLSDLFDSIIYKVNTYLVDFSEKEKSAFNYLVKEVLKDNVPSKFYLVELYDIPNYKQYINYTKYLIRRAITDLKKEI